MVQPHAASIQCCETAFNNGKLNTPTAYPDACKFQAPNSALCCQGLSCGEAGPSQAMLARYACHPWVWPHDIQCRHHPVDAEVQHVPGHERQQQHERTGKEDGLGMHVLLSSCAAARTADVGSIWGIGAAASLRMHWLLLLLLLLLLLRLHEGATGPVDSKHTAHPQQHINLQKAWER